jgi:hypothetical protein
MAYRGDDLDLRTPQAPPGDLATSEPADPFVASSRPRVAAGAARSAPIWVDETLLDCCNHAYDVASAHRAADLRLEHLIYALTRLDDAADILEAHGVRVTSLRREAATVVATEIPAAPGSAKTNPRRTETVEEVLRLAAALAYRRQAPAGVADVIHVLLESGHEFPTLLRFGPVRPAEIAPERETFRERIRGGPTIPQPARGLATDLAVTTQNARLDALEQSLRTLTIELANERKILSGVLQDLQRELMAQREDTSRLGGITQDKIQAMLGDRLQSLEQAFHSGRNGDAVAALQDRLGLLERALQAEISVTRAAVEALAEKPAAVDLGPLLLRLDTIEAAAGAERRRAEAAEQTLSDGIRALSATVERQPREISALVSQPLVEHLNAFAVTRDSQHAAATDSLAETRLRVEALEQALNAHVARTEAAIETAARERGELRALLERLAERSQEGFERSQEGLATLSESITQDLTEVHDGLSRVHSDHQALVSTIDSEAQDAANAFAALAARIDSLEKAAERPVEMLENLSATVAKMHKVTVERYYRRNRFWYWLFGTDDWLAASWPSQSARIAEELRAIRH